MKNSSWQEGRISLSKAIIICKEKGVSISRPTAAEWVKKYNLGIQLGGIHGQYIVDKYRWSLFVATGIYPDQPPESDMEGENGQTA